MKDASGHLVSKGPVRQNYKVNLVIFKTNQVRYVTKSLRRLAPKI